MAMDDHELLIFDGACGTTLQGMDIPASAWEGREGCNEWLSVSAPEIIEDMHRRFLDAGAMVLESNTFGANSVVLAEYGLDDRAAEISAAAVACARRAIGNRPHRYVAGSVGPTTKLASLGQIPVASLSAAYREQMRAMMDAGADALILETCQDLLQVKTGVVAAFETMEAAGREIPLMVSVTIEQTGSMLVGSDIGAVCATLDPFPIFSLGMNCATGPQAMESHIRFLGHSWTRRISCLPNAGLPEVEGGKTIYRLSPEEFAGRLRGFIERDGVSIVGGCCGTTPDHIAALVRACEGLHPAVRSAAGG